MIIEFDSFEAYKQSRGWDIPDLDWLKNKLSNRDFEELKKQVLYHLLEAEEDAFTRGMLIANSTDNGIKNESVRQDA